MIGIWYNPRNEEFYAKHVKGVYFNSDYKIGYINSYGHQLVALFMIKDNKLIQCSSLSDYYNNKKTLKKRLINKFIKFLERRV